MYFPIKSTTYPYILRKILINSLYLAFLSIRKHILKLYRKSLTNVADVIYIKIPQQNTGGAEYVMLLNICRFLLGGMLMNAGSKYKMNG